MRTRNTGNGLCNMRSQSCDSLVLQRRVYCDVVGAHVWWMRIRCMLPVCCLHGYVGCVRGVRTDTGERGMRFTRFFSFLSFCVLCVRGMRAVPPYPWCPLSLFRFSLCSRVHGPGGSAGPGWVAWLRRAFDIPPGGARLGVIKTLYARAPAKARSWW